MAEINTTRTEIAIEVSQFYDKNLLLKAVPAFVHNRFAQVRDIPQNGGTNVIGFRRYGLLSAQTTALSEGVTPTGKQLSTTDLSATVAYYGDYITITDKVLIETYDPILTETADILGEQAGDSLDQLCRNVLIAGCSNQYASSATTTATVTSAMKLTRDEVKQAVRTLQGNNCKPVTKMIDTSTGYNTVPINAAYIGIISEDTLYDLDDATGWIPVEKYANKSDVMPNEVGSLAGVRFLMTTNAYVHTAEGANSQDVHVTLIFGQQAYAQSRISGNALKNIIKPLGSAGSADPLDQRTTSGWKAAYVAKVLNANYIVGIEHSVSA
jgi:N4-gp56 family major capsid protein